MVVDEKRRLVVGKVLQDRHPRPEVRRRTHGMVPDVRPALLPTSGSGIIEVQVAIGGESRQEDGIGIDAQVISGDDMVRLTQPAFRPHHRLARHVCAVGHGAFRLQDRRQIARCGIGEVHVRDDGTGAPGAPPAANGIHIRPRHIALEVLVELAG